MKATNCKMKKKRRRKRHIPPTNKVINTSIYLMIWDRYDILPNTAGQLPKATEVKLCYCQIKTRVFAINMFVGLK